MTRRTANHSTGDRAQTRVRKVFEDVGWAVNELPRDYGEDLLVRICERGRATPFTFFVQSKGMSKRRRGPRFVGAPGQRHYRAQVSQAHVSLWKRLSLPVVVTFWDERSDRIYWEIVAPGELIWPRPRGREGARGVVIPEENALDRLGLRRIRNLVKRQHATASHLAMCLVELLRLVRRHGSFRILNCEPSDPFIAYRLAGETKVWLWGRTARLVRAFQRAREMSQRDLDAFFDRRLRTMGKEPRLSQAEARILSDLRDPEATITRIRRGRRDARLGSRQSDPSRREMSRSTRRARRARRAAIRRRT